MINGKKTRSCAIVYKTLHCLAHHGNILKLLVNAIKNVKPFCEVKKVRIYGTTQLVPSIIATNCQVYSHVFSSFSSSFLYSTTFFLDSN
jgi:ribosomal protein S7